MKIFIILAIIIKIFVSLQEMVMINFVGYYVDKPILQIIRDTKSPKFDEIIETDDVFNKYIAIGDDEHTVLNTIKKNGFDCDISEKDIIIDNERVYKIHHRFNNQITPNHLVVVGKLYFKDEKLTYYKTVYHNTASYERIEDYY